MSFEIWFAFVVASAVLLIIPGPTILTVLSYSLSHGARSNVAVVAGVALGDSTALLVSLLGLGAMLSASATLFMLVKWAGGLYLLYLAFNFLARGLSVTDRMAHAVDGSRWRVFRDAYLVTALNPKSVIFFVAFLPQFIDAAGNTVSQTFVLAVTFVALATVNAALYALFANSARRALRSARVERAFSLAGGTLLGVAGVWALLARRPV